MHRRTVQPHQLGNPGEFTIQELTGCGIDKLAPNYYQPAREDDPIAADQHPAS